MDSLTLFGHLFKTRCEAICIFLDFFTGKRGSHRKIYNFFRKSHKIHCICKRFSIYCNKNCSGNMRILCPFADYWTRNNLRPVRGRKRMTTWAQTHDARNNLHPVRGRKHVANPINVGEIGKQPTPRQGTKTGAFPL